MAGASVAPGSVKTSQGQPYLQLGKRQLNLAQCAYPLASCKWASSCTSWSLRAFVCKMWTSTMALSKLGHEEVTGRAQSYRSRHFSHGCRGQGSGV